MTHREGPNHWHRAVQPQPTVTRKQAEAVLALVEQTFATWLSPDWGSGLVHPALMEDYDGAPYAIVWEEDSPYWWAVTFLDIHPEELVPGVKGEALKSFILAIYPA
jgi:hypothetical protein